MQEQILNEIKKNNKVTYKILLNKFNIGHSELDKLLLELKLDGKILQVKNTYRLFPNDLYLGNVIISGNGKKYIMNNNERISIASNFLNDLFINDVVAYKLNGNNEAEIYSIVDRNVGKMTCELKVENGIKTIIPYRKEVNVKLPYNILDTLYDGDIFVVNIDPDDINNITYVKKIGRRDDPNIDEVVIALNYGFDNDYDEEYMKEVHALPTFVSDEETKGRVDYRKQDSFTIDAKYTKDMDDGLFGEILPNGNIRVYVHIADVSHYIKMHSRIFKRACDKTTSLYLNNSVFHMLHYIISVGICSLNELVDRLTKTVAMEIDPDGHIVDFDIQRSVINSKKKMIYDEVDEILMNGKMVKGYEPFEKTLYILYDAALRLKIRYSEENGMIDFADTEMNKEYNDDGTIKSITEHRESIASDIVKYLMIAANETVANWFINLDIFSVFRNHDIPDARLINSVIEIINKSKFHIKRVKNVDNPKELQKALHSLSSYEEYPILSNMLLMGVPKANYSTVNRGHYALALAAYLQFTSPIRRLADLLVHTLIDLILLKPEKLTLEYLITLQDKFEKLCVRASKMERQADMAERDAEGRSILKSLSMNQEYEASVIDINRKITIRLNDIETTIDANKLNSVFGYDSKRKRYYDRDTGSPLKIGSRLRVKITNIDLSYSIFGVKVLGMVQNNDKKLIRKK